MHAPAATRVSCHTCTLCRKSAMVSAWSCQHAEGLAVVRNLGPAGFYRWWPDGGAGYTAWPLPGGATQGRPAHLHAPPWAWPAITCPHPVECTGQPGATAGAHPDVSSVIPGVCRTVATAGSGQASGPRGRGTTGRSPCRITLYGPAGGLQLGAGCAGQSCISVPASVWYGWVGAWWLSRRCCTHPVWRDRGGAIHRWGLAGAGWIAQIFFGQGGDLAVPRAYTYQTPHSCVGHNP